MNSRDYTNKLLAGLLLAVLLNLSIVSAFQTKRTGTQRKQATSSSSSSDPRLTEAAALLQAGRTDEGEATIRQLLVEDPRNYSGHALLGVVLDQRGKADEAEREYLASL